MIELADSLEVALFESSPVPLTFHMEFLYPPLFHVCPDLPTVVEVTDSITEFIQVKRAHFYIISLWRLNHVWGDFVLKQSFLTGRTHLKPVPDLVSIKSHE